MRFAFIYLSILFVAMILGLALAFTFGDFFADGRIMLSLPWGRLSLLDVYVGFLLFSGWVLFREPSTPRAFLWIVAILLLGNVLAALYAILALRAAGGDWSRFWLGARCGALS